MEARSEEARVGFWPRLGAYFIDFVLLWILAALAAKTVAGLFPEIIANKVAEAAAKAGGKPLPPFVTWLTASSLAIAVLAPIYGLVEGLLGASPGKFVLGLRVVTESNNQAGQPLLLARYGVKHVTSVFQLLALFLGIKAIEHAATVVGVVFIVGCFLAFGQARQALHDKIVGTAILRKSDLPEPVAAPVPGAG
jgi:uncharacterized RDD family membrane protein YckC